MKPICQGPSDKTLTIRLNEGQLQAVRDNAKKNKCNHCGFERVYGISKVSL
mgnify:CR=1 FL=1